MFRDVAKVVIVALAGALCAAMWALSSPLGSSPDDGFHQTTIWCVDATSATEECTVVGEGENSGRLVEVPALLANPQCYAFLPAESAACQRALRGESVRTEALDNGQYPGGFYRVMHWLVLDSIPESVLLMRMVNGALAALLLGAIAVLTTTEIRRLMTYTLAPVLIPLGWFITGSINPSSWSLTGLTAYAFALHTLLSVTSRPRQVGVGILGLLGLAMALAARGDAPVYAVIVTGALCVLHWRRLWADKALVALPVVVGLVCVVRVLGSAQVSSVAGADAETDRGAGEVAANLLLEFPALVSGMFGYGFGLGWLDTPVHPLTAYPVALVLGFLVLTGLGRMTVPKAFACVMIALPMLAFPLMTLYRTRLIVLEGVQPRYLLPLMPALLAVLLTGLAASTTLRLSRVQATAVWVGLTAANTAAIYANLRRYVTGTDGPTIIDDLEWWWQSAPSPATVTLLGGLAFAVFAFPVVLMSGEAAPDTRRGTAPRETAPADTVPEDTAPGDTAPGDTRIESTTSSGGSTRSGLTTTTKETPSG